MTDTHLAHVVLTAPDISCPHCVQTVTETLGPLAGITDVAVDLGSKTVQVAYDPTRITLEAMGDVLASEDYPVAVVCAAPSAS
jgi:copper chaperone